MKPKHQAILSAFAAPGFLFIAAQRFTAGDWGWGAFWLALGAIHALALVGSILMLREQKP